MSIWAIVGTYLTLCAVFTVCWCLIAWRHDMREESGR